MQVRRPDSTVSLGLREELVMWCSVQGAWHSPETPGQCVPGTKFYKLNASDTAKGIKKAGKNSSKEKGEAGPLCVWSTSCELIIMHTHNSACAPVNSI